MKNVTIILAVCAAFVFAGCSDYNLHPASDRINYQAKFGSTEVEADVYLPKDTAGKLMLVELQTHQDQLEGTSEAAESFAAPAGKVGGLFEGTVITPEMSKEYRGVRYMVVDFNQSNNPAVVELTAQLNQAIAEQDTEKVKVLTEAIGEISGAIINKVITQGVN